MVLSANSTHQIKNKSSSGHALANALVEARLGQEIHPLIERYKPCRKASSGYTQDTLPSVADHVATLRASSELLLYSQIVLVDDILTIGTTSTACRLILERDFPNVPVKAFCAMRTKGFAEEGPLKEPAMNTITYDPNTGRVFRDT